MSFDSNAPAALSPTGLSRNVVPLRPGGSVVAAAPRQPVSVYRVRVGGKIFQGRDPRALLRLAVQARASQRID